MERHIYIVRYTVHCTQGDIHMNTLERNKRERKGGII